MLKQVNKQCLFIFMFDTTESKTNNVQKILNKCEQMKSLNSKMSLCLLLLIKIKQKRNNSFKFHKQFYFHSFCSASTPHIVLQENCIYVDKDILDARQRGEADNYEIPHTSLTLGRSIGKGAFGRVYLARADNISGFQGSQLVAVKKLRSKIKIYIYIVLVV